MKIAILAPESMGNYILETARKYFSDIEILLLVYNDYKECVKLLQKNKKKYDGIVFAGIAAYSYSKKFLKPQSIWEYMPLHEGSLTNAILQGLYNGYDIKHISIDCYSIEHLKELFRILNIKLSSVEILNLNIDTVCENCNDLALNFHINNYKKNKNTCIITALNTVHKQLLDLNINNFFAEPTESVIKQIFQNILLKYNLQINKKSQIVIGYIQINFPNEYSIINLNEYYYMMEKNKLSEIIYLFAQNIKAAVTEVSFNTYQLVSTRNILEVETNNFRTFSILDSVSKNSLHTLSIGFGYGKTADEAKSNANLAMMKSQKTAENCVYVIYENKEVLRPIKNTFLETDNKIDSKLLSISEKCNISLNKIFNIYNAINKYKKNTFTPKELSNICKMSIRSTNKLLTILENNGYTEIVGKKFSEGSGRPSRIIKFRF